MTIAEALDHLKLNNALVMDLVQCHKHTYEFEIKDTTDTDRSASHLDLHLEIDSEGGYERHLTTKEIILIFPL